MPLRATAGVRRDPSGSLATPPSDLCLPPILSLRSFARVPASVVKSWVVHSAGRHKRRRKSQNCRPPAPPLLLVISPGLAPPTLARSLPYLHTSYIAPQLGRRANPLNTSWNTTI